jgi:tetratricopeptide (TPR) repeat protein
MHVAGRLDEAVRAYAESERALEAAGLPAEALRAAVDRVDALATSGEVEAAVRLADSLARRARRPSFVAASLAVNRANALRLRGDLSEAIRAYEAAARDLGALGSAYGAGIARMNAGVAWLEAGDVDRARERLRRAVRELSDAGLDDQARDARQELASVEVQAGELGEGIRAFERLAQEYRAAGLERREGLCRMDLASALRRAGDRETAEREAVRAAAAFRAVHADAERAEALWFAASAAAPGRPETALERLRAARAAARRSERPAVVLRCELLAFDAALRRGRAPPPRALRALADRADRMGQSALRDDARLLAATAALERGRTAEARALFASVAAAARSRPWTALAAETGLAAAEARDPARRGKALARLRRTARFLDAVRGRLPGAWLRASFVAERLDPYLARVDLLLERGRPADRREAEALLDALGARRFLEARPPRIGRGLERARRRLESAYDRLARAEAPSRGSESPPAALPLLVARVRAWERAVAEAWRREERRSTAPGERTTDPSPARVGDDAAIVHLWRRGDEARGLVRVGDAVGPAVSLGPVSELEGFAGAARLHGRRWALFREAGGADPRGIDRVLSELSRRTLGPLGADRWPANVFVVSDPALPDLPWELLPHEGERLGESRRLLRAPSASVRPRAVARGRGTTVLAVGDPGLPGVDAEVASVAEAAGAARVITGAAATREAALLALRDSRVVHVAGHGWDAEEAPALAGIRLADGWLAATDLPRGGVGADLVVLAACRTGKASGRATLAWGGLVTALLSAGARRVSWTLDDVDDAATAALMARFHRARQDVDDVLAFGGSLAQAARESGHAGSVVAFRMTGVRT